MRGKGAGLSGMAFPLGQVPNARTPYPTGTWQLAATPPTPLPVFKTILHLIYLRQSRCKLGNVYIERLPSVVLRIKNEKVLTGLPKSRCRVQGILQRGIASYFWTKVVRARHCVTNQNGRFFPHHHDHGMSASGWAVPCSFIQKSSPQKSESKKFNALFPSLKPFRGRGYKRRL